MVLDITALCVIDGESTSKAFSLKISSPCTVVDLQKLIKAERSHLFNDIAAHDLTLWRISGPAFSTLRYMPVVIAENSAAIELSPFENLFNEYISPGKTIHLIVQRPHRVAAAATFTVLVKGRTPMSIQWATDAVTATLSEMREQIYAKHPYLNRASGPVVIVRPNYNAVMYLETDEDLRAHLKDILRDGDRFFSVRLEGRSRPFSEFTMTDIDRIYGDNNLQILGTIGSAPVTVPTYTQAVVDLLTSLKSAVKALYPGKFISPEPGCPLYVSIFLIHAVGLFPELMLIPNKAISGRRGNGYLDYAVVSKDDPSRMIAVTASGPTESNSLFKTMVQLDTISSGRKQNSRDHSGDGGAEAPVISYGIVTDSANWSFLECKTEVLYESGYNDPTFFLSTSPVVLRFSDEFHDWKGNAIKIFRHITFQLQRLVDDIPNPSKRRKLATHVKHPQPPQVELQLPSQTVDEYWLWAQSLSKDFKGGQRTGKWMLFYDNSVLDEKWAAVKSLTEQDMLGGKAKCSTARENPKAKSSKTGVIIVYTYDYLDQEDVYRVAANLHEKMEYKRIMYYKTDNQTYAGTYAKNGSKVNHVYKYPLD